VELQEQSAIDLSCGEVDVPDWADRELPDPVRVYNFAVRQLMLLAAACPEFEVRAAAARFLCSEFPPAKSSRGAGEKAEFIAHLRRAIAGYLPASESSAEEEDVELEAYDGGTNPRNQEEGT
jgi:hypothetical protein